MYAAILMALGLEANDQLLPLRLLLLMERTTIVGYNS